MDNILVFRTGILGTWREKFAGVADFARTAGWRLQPVDAREARPDLRRLLRQELQNAGMTQVYAVECTDRDHRIVQNRQMIYTIKNLHVMMIVC